MAIVTAITAIAASVATAASAIGAAAVGAGTAAAAIGATAVAASQLGMVIGVVGLGMSVVGMATGNKSLAKIGGYLGMAGGVLSVGGALAGGMPGAMKGFASAWDDGVGSLFSSTKSVGQAPLGSVGNVTAQNATTVQTAPAQTGSVQSATPSLNIGPRPQASAAFNDSLIPGSMAKNVLPPGTNPSGLSQTVTPGDMSKFANAAPGGAPSATANLGAVTSQANAGPLAGMTGAPQLATHHLAPDSLSNLGGSTKSFWESLPDWAKGQVAISGAQGLAGMAGGWFEGATAEEKLALEREAQQWRMQHEDSIKNFNQRNASYAPLVTFNGGGGMLSKGKA